MHIKNNPDDGNALNARAISFLNCGEYERAFQDAEQICKQFNSNQGYLRLGKAMMGKGEPIEKAI